MFWFFLLDRIGPQLLGDDINSLVRLIQRGIIIIIITIIIILLGDDINSLVRLIQRGTPNAPVPAERGEAAAQLVGLMLTVDARVIIIIIIIIIMITIII